MFTSALSTKGEKDCWWEKSRQSLRLPLSYENEISRDLIGFQAAGRMILCSSVYLKQFANMCYAMVPETRCWWNNVWNLL